MIEIEEIKNNLLHSSEISDEEDFVAAACTLNENGTAEHAGLIICLDKNLYFLHYTGYDILLENGINYKYSYCKRLDFIESEYIGVFLGYCKKISENSKPKYGYIYSGSFYRDGKYFSDCGIPEYMSCVGFCLNVIDGYIESDYFMEYADWTFETVSTKHINYFITIFKELNPELSEETILASIRRISPLEYITSSFINSIPVRKVKIDLLSPKIQSVLIDKSAIFT